MVDKNHNLIKDIDNKGTSTPHQGGDLFIVDNSDETWKVVRYLHDWADDLTPFIEPLRNRVFRIKKLSS